MVDKNLEEFKQEQLKDKKEKTWDNLLNDYANNASNIQFTTHPSKFSHPEAKASMIIFQPDKILKGFVSNRSSKLDISGNASLLGIYKLLYLELDDGKTVLAHLEEETDKIKEEFKIQALSFDELKNKLLAPYNNIQEKSHITDNKVKQVYFPINNEGEYHLLSVLSPSIMMDQLNTKLEEYRLDLLRSIIMDQLTSKDSKNPRSSIRLDEIKSKLKEYSVNFSDKIIKIQIKSCIKNLDSGEKNSSEQHTDKIVYKMINNLTKINYGGANPRNISGLNSNNSKNGGGYYVLETLPPFIHKRKIRLPKYDFFNECLYKKDYEPYFWNLKKKLSILDHVNNEDKQQNFGDEVMNLFDYIIGRVWSIRRSVGNEGIEENWSEQENYKNLENYQKTLLNDKYSEQRTPEWKNEVIHEISRWIVITYKELLGKILGDACLNHIKELIKEYDEVIM